ncbi:hypothetical protein BaRGS_00024928 [Batillaria attramentaria]|uniref:Uncharacterized protein n=1 Tax=Batillaria attramentaria TaxID=370345 RepID=A0ABD0K9M9_9CAEN
MDTTVHLFLIGVILSTFPLPASSATCNVTSVFWGEPAEVTCFFDENVEDTKKSFKVHVYDVIKDDPDNHQLQYHDTVLSCYWKTHDDRKCNMKNGYQLQWQSEDKLSLKIENTTEHSFGKYFGCQVVPWDRYDIHPCLLSLREADEWTVLPSPVEETTMKSTERPTDSTEGRTEETTRASEQSKSDSKSEPSIEIIIVPILAVLAVILSIAVILVRRKRKVQESNKRKSQSKGEEEKGNGSGRTESEHMLC